MKKLNILLIPALLFTSVQALTTVSQLDGPQQEVSLQPNAWGSNKTDADHFQDSGDVTAPPATTDQSSAPATDQTPPAPPPAEQTPAEQPPAGEAPASAPTTDKEAARKEIREKVVELRQMAREGKRNTPEFKTLLDDIQNLRKTAGFKEGKHRRMGHKGGHRGDRGRGNEQESRGEEGNR